MNKKQKIIQYVKKQLLRWFCFIFIFLGIGYLSSVLSKANCENHMAKIIIYETMKGETFYVPAPDITSKEIFERVGGKVSLFVMVPKTFKKMTWPDGKVISYNNHTNVATIIRGDVTFPFIVIVDYSTCTGSLCAEGAYMFYFALFGWPIKIGKICYMRS